MIYVRQREKESVDLVVRKGLFTIAAIIGIIGLFSWMFGSSSPSTTASSAPVVDTAIHVSDYQLYYAYKQNEVAADRVYKGKQLVVSCRIDSIGTGVFSESPNIVLNGGGLFAHVQADFGDGDAAAKMYPGEFVTLRCTGSGAILGDPMLSDCTLEPPPVPVVTQAPQPTPQPEVVREPVQVQPKPSPDVITPSTTDDQTSTTDAQPTPVEQ